MTCKTDITTAMLEIENSKQYSRKSIKPLKKITRVKASATTLVIKNSGDNQSSIVWNSLLTFFAGKADNKTSKRNNIA
jgi:hypothetical protein